MSNPASPDWAAHARMNAADRWERPSADMGRGATEAIVELASPQPGMRVLDVASGTGAPALQLARRVLPGGHVTATDLNSEPLKIAARRAAERGLNNLSFLAADVHALPYGNGEFDLVTSRLAVMFFSDLPRAVSEIHRVLKPGGRVALLAWGPVHQPYFDCTAGVIIRLTGAELPASAKPVFKFAEQGKLAAALTAAGFSGVKEELRTVPWVWTAGVAELWEYFQSATVPCRPLVDQIPANKRYLVSREVQAAFARYWDGEKVNMTADFVLASATKS